MKLTYFSDKLHKDSSFFSPIFRSERQVAIRRKGGRGGGGFRKDAKSFSGVVGPVCVNQF